MNSDKTNISCRRKPKLIIFSVFFALRAATVLSVLLGIVCGVFARPIMYLCNHQADTVEMSVTFFRIIMVCMLFQNLSVVLNSALRGIGKTRVTLFSSIAMGAVDILVNYLLIEGHLGFPRLEVAGDAIATVCGTVAACLFSVVFLIRSSGFLHLKGVFSRRAGDKALTGRIRSKAAGIVSENILTRIGFLLSSIILSTLQSGQTAVYSVTMILLNYTFAFGDGLQTAALTLVGRSMGAKQYDSVREYNRKCRILSFLLAAVLSGLYIFGAEWFFGRFFADSDSVKLGVRFTYVAALLTVLQILRLVNVGTMRGIGDVKSPMIIASICVLLVNPLMSWLLTVRLSHGIWGIWQASVASQGLWFLAAFLLSERDMRHAL